MGARRPRRDPAHRRACSLILSISLEKHWTTRRRTANDAVLNLVVPIGSACLEKKKF